MEARYQHYMEQGEQEKAEEYRLIDPQDLSNVTTVQFYDRQSFINPCLTSSKRFVAKVISEVKAMHKEVDMPLNAWHYGGDEAKNIKLGSGFQDQSEASLEGKGSIDLSKENKPYELSPRCVDMMQAEGISDANGLLTYFSGEVSEIVEANHIPTFQIWSDGLKYNKGSEEFATENVRVNLWDTVAWGAPAKANQLVNDGYELVLSNPDFVYFDMPYEVDKHERGYYWATRATDTKKAFSFVPENLAQNAELTVDREGKKYVATSPDTAAPKVHGISAALWSETIRTDDQYEYMTFPRLFAVAERSWNTGDWEQEYEANTEYSSSTKHTDLDALNQDWSRFANILGQRELAKAELRDLHFRLPVPGAEVEEGKLVMNVSYPGIAMEYSTNMGESWQAYFDEKKPEVSGVVLIRSVSPSGQRSSRVTLIAAK
ncbi:beta-hexosaminidase [Vibrio sp. JCM 19236]|nr:beta-hexosaminidase [Vibrio sp. JCM 19236]